MEVWKLLFGLAGVLVVFTAVAEVTDTSLSSPDGILVLVGVLVFSVLFYFTTRYGYRIGQQVGEDLGEEE